MIIDGVNFNEAEVAKLSKAEFEQRHLSVLWQDRDEATRKKMLSAAYNRIKPAEKDKKTKS